MSMSRENHDDEHSLNSDRALDQMNFTESVEDDGNTGEEQARDPVELASPVTLSGIWEDLLAHTPERHGRPMLVYSLHLLVTFLFHSGFHLAFLYRWSAFFHKTKIIVLARLIEKIIQHWYMCVIPASVRMGPGVFIPHALGIVLNKHVRIGRDVYIRQYAQVIDVRHPGEDGLIGDRVQLNAFSMVIRGGSVGEDSIVGAKAMVNKPIPPRHLAVGVPAEARPLRDEQIIERVPRWK